MPGHHAAVTCHVSLTVTLCHVSGHVVTGWSGHYLPPAAAHTIITADDNRLLLLLGLSPARVTSWRGRGWGRGSYPGWCGLVCV